MKTTLECSVCGAPTDGRHACCCASCDLARRIPLGADGLPISWQLGVALGAFFVYFNQLLFAAMYHLSVARQDERYVFLFASLSLLAGFFSTAGSFALFALAQPKRWTGYAVWLLAVSLPGIGLRFGEVLLGASFLYAYAFANALILIFLGKGLLRLWLSKSPKKRS